MSHAVPSRRECGAAARSIRAAEHGRRADLWARPRAAAGLFRSRPPLSLVLYLAAKAGLLVWQPKPEGADLVLLSPPEPGPSGASGPDSVQRPFLDRWWGPLFFSGVAVAALGVAALAVVGVLLLSSPRPVTIALAVTGLFLPLLALLWAVVILIVIAGREARILFRLIERSPEDLAELAQNDIGGEWNVALLHVSAAVDVPELIQQARIIAGGTGSRLLCPEQAVTTSVARDEVRRLGRVMRLSGRPPTVVTAIGPKGGSVRRRRPPTGTGLTLLLFGTVAVIGVEAKVVADAERAACTAGDCLGRPTSFVQAVSWLLSRLVIVDLDGGLTARTPQAQVTGWFVSFFLLAVAGCAYVLVRRAVSAHRTWRERGDGLPIGGTRVFLNYRGLHDGWAVTLDQALCDRFGADHVFQASRSIEPGEDFVARLLAAVRDVDVLVALIGPGWTDVTDAAGRRRLDDPDDWVRREIVEALASRVEVIPVLVDEVRMPREDQLPAELAPLARCQPRRLARRTVDLDLPEVLRAVATAAARRPGEPHPAGPADR